MDNFHRQAYFVAWTPKDTRQSYDKVEKTVEYDIYLQPLLINGHNCSISAW